MYRAGRDLNLLQPYHGDAGWSRYSYVDGQEAPRRFDRRADSDTESESDQYPDQNGWPSHRRASHRRWKHLVTDPYAARLSHGRLGDFLLAENTLPSSARHSRDQEISHYYWERHRGRELGQSRFVDQFHMATSDQNVPARGDRRRTGGRLDSYDDELLEDRAERIDRRRRSRAREIRQNRYYDSDEEENRYAGRARGRRGYHTEEEWRHGGRRLPSRGRNVVSWSDEEVPYVFDGRTGDHVTGHRWSSEEESNDRHVIDPFETPENVRRHRRPRAYVNPVFDSREMFSDDGRNERSGRHIAALEPDRDYGRSWVRVENERGRDPGDAEHDHQERRRVGPRNKRYDKEGRLGPMRYRPDQRKRHSLDAFGERYQDVRSSGDERYFGQHDVARTYDGQRESLVYTAEDRIFQFTEGEHPVDDSRGDQQRTSKADAAIALQGQASSQTAQGIPAEQHEMSILEEEGEERGVSRELSDHESEDEQTRLAAAMLKQRRRKSAFVTAVDGNVDASKEGFDAVAVVHERRWAKEHAFTHGVFRQVGRVGLLVQKLMAAEQFRRDTSAHFRLPRALTDLKPKVARHGVKAWKNTKVSGRQLLSKLALWGGSLKTIEGQFGAGIRSYFSMVRFLLFLNLYMTLLTVLFLVIPQAVLAPSDFLETLSGFCGFSLPAAAVASNESVTSLPAELSKNFARDMTIVPTGVPYVTTVPPTAALAGLTSKERCFSREAKTCTERYELYLKNTTEGGIQVLLDFLQGTGPFENTLLFIGAYFNKTLNASFLPTGFDTVGGGSGAEQGSSESYSSIDWNMSLAVILVAGVSFLLSLLLILYTAASDFRAAFVGSERTYYQYSNKVFASWEYPVNVEKQARHQHAAVFTELSKLIADQERARMRASRTLCQKSGVLLKQLLVNAFVLVLLGCAGVLIWYTQQQSLTLLEDNNYYRKDKFLGLFVQYLPSLVITALNVVLPFIFKMLVRIEDYSPNFEIKILLMRTVFLRLASVIVLLSTVLPQIESCPDMKCGNCLRGMHCWETYIGQQIYKLVLLDFVVLLVNTFVVELSRSIIYSRLRTRFSLVQQYAQPEFEISKNVIDIVYAQTLCWVGFFFSPLIPAICIIKCFIIFYVKRWTLVHNCQRSDKQLQVSRVNSFFMLILLTSFVLSCMPAGYAVAKLQPSQTCGPFRLYSETNYTMFTSIDNFVLSMPPGIMHVFRFIRSATFVVPLCLLLMLLIYYFASITAGQKRKINILKAQILSAGQTKQHLVGRVRTAMQAIDSAATGSADRGEDFNQSAPESGSPAGTPASRRRAGRRLFSHFAPTLS